MQVAKTIAHFETILVDAINKDSTTMSLDSISTPEGNLPSGLYGFVIEQESNAKREYVIGTLSGSTVTFVTRDVSPLDGSTANSSSDDDRKSHRKGSSVKLTNHPTLIQIYRILTGDASLTFGNPILYASEPTLTNREELATVGYVLDNVNGGTVSYSKVVETGNAGETVAAGDPLYFKTSDQEWYITDADTKYSEDTQFGIAQGAGTDGAAITGGILRRGTDNNQIGMTAGASQYLSTTKGELTETAPTNDIFVGVAKSTTELMVNFENRITDYVNSSNDVTQDSDLQTQTTSTNTIEVGEADATTKKNSLAQKFTASKTKMRGFDLYKKADTGSFTGNVVITLQADSSGSPSGTALATATITNAQWLLLADDAEFEALFASEYTSLVIGDDYWIDVQPSTSDNSNHPNLGGDTSGGDGTVYYNNTTDGWVSISNAYLYYKTKEGNTNQVIKTGDSGHITNTLGNVTVREFTTNGTWTKPSDLKFIKVELWGGGGGGGSNQSTNSPYASGGGGGAYSEKIIKASDLGATETVTVGAGGAGNTSGDGDGAVGGTSSFGSHVSAYGGGGGEGASASSGGGGGGGGGQASAGATGTSTGGDGGNPKPVSTDSAGNTTTLGKGASGTTNANPNFSGGGGGGDGSQGDPSVSVYGGGGGGSRTENGAASTYGGGGGAGGDSSSSASGGTSIYGGDGGDGGRDGVAGSAGSIPAGGGGAGGSNAGQTTSTAGGDGARGEVIITEYYN